MRQRDSGRRFILSCNSRIVFFRFDKLVPRISSAFMRSCDRFQSSDTIFSYLTEIRNSVCELRCIGQFPKVGMSIRILHLKIPLQDIISRHQENTKIRTLQIGPRRSVTPQKYSVTPNLELVEPQYFRTLRSLEFEKIGIPAGKWASSGSSYPRQGNLFDLEPTKFQRG